jgi:SAM-dependent methyltransferase
VAIPFQINFTIYEEMPMGAQSGPLPTGPKYVLDNAAEETRRRFAGLTTVFDPGTFRLLAERGVTIGWRCLEIGAGSGTVAAWLGERVGPSGHVLATDINPRFAEEGRAPNIEIRRHDATVDPLPEAAFDLIHARLVLIHLPTREAVLRKLISTAKPGGWLLIEDFDTRTIVPDASLDPAEEDLKSRAGMFQVMENHGVDLQYGRRITGHMQAAGLSEIGAEARAFRWQGGSPGAGIDWANIQQMREAILATGLVNEAELEADLARLDDPKFAYPSPVMWAAWGRRKV